MPAASTVTLEYLLEAYVAQQLHTLPATPQRQAGAALRDWNAVHAAVGSFADEHSTL